jgi:hypothetical protein
MRKSGNILSACILVIGVSGIFTTAVRAEPVPVPGAYRCSSYNVSGGGGSCRNMPRLLLHSDGTYDFSSSRGRWNIDGGKLHLSDAQFWGPGEIIGGDTVRFEYDYRGWRHTVTWICQECGSAAPSFPAPIPPPISPPIPQPVQYPPMPPGTQQGYSPPPPQVPGGMPEGRFSETPPVPTPAAPPGSGNRSGMQDFINSLSELGKAFEGIKKRPSPNTGSAPPASFPPAAPGYQASGPPVPEPPGYQGSPPPAYDAGSAVPGYGGNGAMRGGQAPLPDQAPRCNPNIPKYSQAGCVE